MRRCGATAFTTAKTFPTNRTASVNMQYTQNYTPPNHYHVKPNMTFPFLFIVEYARSKYILLYIYLYFFPFHMIVYV